MASTLAKVKDAITDKIEEIKEVIRDERQVGDMEHRKHEFAARPELYAADQLLRLRIVSAEFTKLDDHQHAFAVVTVGRNVARTVPRPIYDHKLLEQMNKNNHHVPGMAGAAGTDGHHGYVGKQQMKKRPDEYLYHTAINRNDPTGAAAQLPGAPGAAGITVVPTTGTNVAASREAHTTGTIAPAAAGATTVPVVPVAHTAVPVEQTFVTGPMHQPVGHQDTSHVANAAAVPVVGHVAHAALTDPVNTNVIHSDREFAPVTTAHPNPAFVVPVAGPPAGTTATHVTPAVPTTTHVAPAGGPPPAPIIPPSHPEHVAVATGGTNIPIDCPRSGFGHKEVNWEEHFSIEYTKGAEDEPILIEVFAKGISGDTFLGEYRMKIGDILAPKRRADRNIETTGVKSEKNTNTSDINPSNWATASPKDYPLTDRKGMKVGTIGLLLRRETKLYGDLRVTVNEAFIEEPNDTIRQAKCIMKLLNEVQETGPSNATHSNGSTHFKWDNATKNFNIDSHNHVFDIFIELWNASSSTSQVGEVTPIHNTHDSMGQQEEVNRGDKKVIISPLLIGQSRVTIYDAWDTINEPIPIFTFDNRHVGFLRVHAELTENSMKEKHAKEEKEQAKKILKAQHPIDEHTKKAEILDAKSKAVHGPEVHDGRTKPEI